MDRFTAAACVAMSGSSCSGRTYRVGLLPLVVSTAGSSRCALQCAWRCSHEAAVMVDRETRDIGTLFAGPGGAFKRFWTLQGPKPKSILGLVERLIS